MSEVEFLVMDLVLADHQHKIGYWNMLVCRRYCIRNVNMNNNLVDFWKAPKLLAARDELL